LAAKRPIKMPRLTWMRLLSELRQRGRGQRESGAFLLGRVDDVERRVECFVCYDDLDPRALESGIVMFHASGLSALWQLCSQRGVEVLADVHTHPTSDVRQSLIDQRNPMLPLKGHVALILPRYGRASKWSLSGVGMYLFEGGNRWQASRSESPSSLVQLCNW
jgi:proteasome lid subunit RPN8/RPN11